LDDALLEQLTKGLAPIEDDEEEEEGDLELFFEQAGGDPCGTNQFQMNMIMPDPMSGLEEEPPIDLYEKGSAEAITA
jgi:hypothetical protein